MTTLTAVPAARRLERLTTLIGVARAVLFVAAIGVFLSAPPSLPWVLAVVALTNVLHLGARAWMTGTRPLLLLMLTNGTTVTLVLGYVALTALRS